jgi:hypothetical protein
MKDKQIAIFPDARKAMAQLRMEMVKLAQVNIKNIFPALGMSSSKAEKSGSYTKKGSGRKHLQGK